MATQFPGWASLGANHHCHAIFPKIDRVEHRRFIRMLAVSVEFGWLVESAGLGDSPSSSVTLSMGGVLAEGDIPLVTPAGSVGSDHVVWWLGHETVIDTDAVSAFHCLRMRGGLDQHRTDNLQR